jgi:hypothetical protein
MLPAALDVILGAEHAVNRGAQCLGTVDHKQPLAVGIDPLRYQSLQGILRGCGIFSRSVENQADSPGKG